MNDSTPEKDVPDEPIEAVRPSKMSRRRMWIVAGCVLAVVAAGIVALTVGGDRAIKPDDASDLPEHCETEPTKTGVTEPESPRRIGEIEVLETGFSTSDDIKLDREDGQVGFGAVLKNTSVLVARNVEVTLSATWPDGTPVKLDNQEYPDDPVAWKGGPWKIGSLVPGEEFGFGMVRYILNEYPANEPELTLKVETTVEEWWEPDNDVHDFAPITAEFHKEDTTGHLRFTVDSESCEAVGKARVGLVFRNGDGEIVGGWINLKVSRPTDNTWLAKYPAGRTATVVAEDTWGNQTIDDDNFQQVADMSKTEVYPYADPNVKD